MLLCNLRHQNQNSEICADWAQLLWQGEGRQSRHAPLRYCSTLGGHSNPTVYRYTLLRLNTRPGEGMTECIVWVQCALRSVCIFLPSFFSPFECQCVFTCEPAVRSHTPTPLPQYICCGEQRGVCVQVRWCVCLRNAEQPRLPPHAGTKKELQPGGHFEIPGAHLANPGNWGVYISATEKGKSPDASWSRVHIDHSPRHGWQTYVYVGGEVYRRHWAKSMNTLWWLALGDVTDRLKLAPLVQESTFFSSYKPHIRTHTLQKHTLILCGLVSSVLAPFSCSQDIE